MVIQSLGENELSMEFVASVSCFSSDADVLAVYVSLLQACLSHRIIRNNRGTAYRRGEFACWV